MHLVPVAHGFISQVLNIILNTIKCLFIKHNLKTTEVLYKYKRKPIPQKNKLKH